MRLIKVRWFSMIAASVLFAGGVLGACSDDAGTSLTKLEVSPPTATLAVATTQQLEATGIYSDGTSKNVSTTVTWASSDDAVATVSAAGLVEAKQDGTATIKATLLGIEATATITVSTATLSTIEVTPTDPSIAVATTQQFTATGVFSDQSTQDLTNQVAWTSADTKVAEITSAGLATGNAAGKSTITATLPGTSGTTVITVSAATLTTIEVTPVAPTLAVGAQEQFKATGVFSDKTTQDITTQVTWASSDAAIATISDAAADKGLAKALAKGTTTITATLSGTVGKTDLTVTDATLTSIDVTPAAPSIAKGSTQQFTATATYSDKSTQDITTQVTWASSDAAVATVSNATADMGLATALKKGTTTIKASLSGVDGTTTLTVTDATLTAIEVTPTTPSIAKSSTQQFIATGTYSDQSTQDITAQVTWSSSDVTVAMISNATADMGLATALAKGTTT
ncbi:MAG: Ig-like domain-containing protein, partial [Deltaproteobacteria bacterium]|nr:Ig-like domain-containing protein [Deltaproteobacteria bacterium]